MLARSTTFPSSVELMPLLRTVPRFAVSSGAALVLLLVHPASSAGATFAPAPMPTDRSPEWIYTFTDLGPGGATAISNKGQVVGTSAPTTNKLGPITSGLAFSWQAGVRHDLQPLPGHQFNTALAVNDAGQVAGASAPDGNPRQEQAVVWQGTSVRILPMGFGVGDRATALNRAGQVAGWIDNAPEDSAVLWDKAGTLHSLTFAIGNHHSTYAFGINERGQVVGGGSGAAWVWKAGVVRELDAGAAYAINNHGWVVGESAARHAMLWTNGHSKDLGTLPGGTSSTALAINQQGSIVGSATTATGHSHAFLCTSGRLVDLNDAARPSSGWELVVATGVNNRGQIVGTGTLQGKSHAVLLTPEGSRGAASPC
jgi:probable HAF family extracellular repeat protein